MSKRPNLFTRILFLCTVAAICAATLYGLDRFNAAMEVRYQAVGIIVDEEGNPIEGVEALLVLSPPPRLGAQLDELFAREAMIHKRSGLDGKVKRPVGPAIGLSGSNGGVIVRATGRLGPSHAIRMGLDSSGKPPYEIAWIVLRKGGYKEMTMTISILGWKQAPPDWGRHANRLPRLVLTQ